MPVIVVWLGEVDCVKYDSLRIVSKHDLLILAQSDETLYKTPSRSKYQPNMRKYHKNKRLCAARQNHLNNLAKNYFNIADERQNHPILKRKAPRERQKMREHQGWDFFDDSCAFRGNGWKDNSRTKRQYLKYDKKP